MNDRIDRGGLTAAITAFVIWGFMPIFFKQLVQVPAIEVIGHRVIWALPFLLVIIAIRGQISEFIGGISQWSQLRWLIVSAVLVSTNWLIFVYAVGQNQLVATSLGYYLNPLVNILLGTVFLKEKLNRAQWAAVAVAVVAVAVLALGSLSTAWISLILACSFGLYGLVRKMAPVGAVPGLAIETMILLPLALAVTYYLAQTPAHTGWGSTPAMTGLLIASGVLTAIPLLLFAIAARRMPYSIMAFIQYIGPTISLLIAVFIYNEPLSGVRALSLGLIWVALGIFSWDMWRRMRLAD